jgi:hypothetical protein
VEGLILFCGQVKVVKYQLDRLNTAVEEDAAAVFTRHHKFDMVPAANGIFIASTP